MAYKRISPVPITEGGTNTKSFSTTDGTIYFDGTSLNVTATGSSGEVLTSNGVGFAPSFQSIPPSGGSVVTTFTSSDSWTKNANTTFVQIFGWSGGNGGGSGRQGVTALSGGGGGGGPASTFFYEASANFFAASETVTIGAGGSGGIAQAGANTDGNSGSAGGTTRVGNVGIENAGSGSLFGSGGTTTTAAGGLDGWFFTTVNRLYSVQANILEGGQGRASNGEDGDNTGEILSPSSSSWQSTLGLCSTGGGGGAGADSVIPRQGGNAGSTVFPNSAIDIIVGGAGGIESGIINGGSGASGTLSSGGRILGGTGGGGGGGQSSGGSAGIGGAGGVPGSGGGGGGGSLNGTSSGAGGNGGDGLVIIIEFLG